MQASIQNATAGPKTQQLLPSGLLPISKTSMFLFSELNFHPVPLFLSLVTPEFQKRFRSLDFEDCYGVALLPGAAAPPIVQPCMSLKGCHEGSEPS